VWLPTSLPAGGARYLALADVVERDVRSGRLAPGDRLPPQRLVAERLGLDLTTVTRAYAEARSRGLISGQVGRGTFVLASAAERASGDAGLVDLSLNVPPLAVTALAGDAMARTLAGIGAGEMAELAQYGPTGGRAQHRQAGAAWIARRGIDAAAERVVVCGGSQHALTVLLLTLLEPGAEVMAEALTYPGFRGLAEVLRLRVRGLEMDGQGITPAAFRAGCQAGARVLYTVPTFQNPTGAVMGAERRAELVAIAREFGVAIVEDDVYGVMSTGAEPQLCALAPELGWFVSGLSKSVAPGLRIAYLLAPDARGAERMAAAVGHTTWMAPPLMAEVAARWVGDGTAARLLNAARAEAVARQRVGARLLDGLSFTAAAESYHVWLQVPAPWTPASLVERAARDGIVIPGPERFAVTREVPAAVRLSLSGARDVRELERTLARVAALLREAPAPQAPLL
jgi:DNA-binding transcriptional MocR family regulator